MTATGSSKLLHAILINVSYPTSINKRGTVSVPEMPIGAATLPLLAALVHQYRPDCEVRAYDEIGTPVDLDYIDGLPRENTLILMSVRTTLAYEAFQMSARFREMGFAVVLGGPHVSACQDEAAQYANGAVHGEAEVHMKDIIEAFESGALKATTSPGLRFRSDKNCDLSSSPIPERELYKSSKTYMHTGVIEFSRGCHNRCSFCASSNLYTRTLSFKSIGQVLAEISTLPAYPGGFRFWFFGDDNFTTSHERAKKLSIEIGRHYPAAKWGCAMTIASARDPELLDAMAAGGLRYVFIGFDSILQGSLADAHKTAAKASQFEKLIKELKKRNIHIVAAMVLGFDNDDVSVFKKTLTWSLETGVDQLNLNVLRPYPSSPLYQTLKQEGRMLYDPWWLQSFETRLSMVHGLSPNISGVMTTFQPKNMSAKELAEGTLWLGREFYRAKNVFSRVMKNYKNVTTLLLDVFTNYYYAKEFSANQKIADPGSCHVKCQPSLFQEL